MKDEMEGQVTFADLGIWSGKMSQEPSVQTKEKTSRQSLKKSLKSQNRNVPICLRLSKVGGCDGQNQDVSMMRWENGQLLGDFTTASFGTSPSEEQESRLSQILEVSAHPKYSLSEKACAGILRRAKERGKELPEILRQALENQIQRGSDSEN